MRAWLVPVVVAAACERVPRLQPSAGPDPAAPAVVAADSPDALPDQEREGSFILPPEREGDGASFVLRPEPDRPTDPDCAATLGRSQYWCATPEAALPFATDRRPTRACPEHLRGRGPDADLDGADGLPACAVGFLEPCKTETERAAGRVGICCYAWACPTH